MSVSMPPPKGVGSIVTDKAMSICLLRILMEYSDEHHVLQMKDIQLKMKTLYELETDRRTIYSAIDLLNELGYEISSYEDAKGYYLMNRLFEPGEVRLLMDAVYSYPFIPTHQGKDLIEKLQTQISIHQRRHYTNLTIDQSGRKTSNRQVFYNIEILDEAITKKVKVKFHYLKYDVSKNLVARRDKKYTVNPYGMIYTNEHYYLVCILSKQNNTSLYRIDRMQDIQKTELTLDHQEANFNPRASIEKSIYAFSGEPVQIQMVCDLNIVFGKLFFYQCGS